jgi:hypothetical protein
MVDTRVGQPGLELQIAYPVDEGFLHTHTVTLSALYTSGTGQGYDR